MTSLKEQGLRIIVFTERGYDCSVKLSNNNVMTLKISFKIKNYNLIYKRELSQPECILKDLILRFTFVYRLKWFSKLLFSLCCGESERVTEITGGGGCL